MKQYSSVVTKGCTEIMNRSKLNQHWKPESTERLSRPSMRLLDNEHPPTFARVSNPGSSVSHVNT